MLVGISFICVEQNQSIWALRLLNFENLALPEKQWDLVVSHVVDMADVV